MGSILPYIQYTTKVNWSHCYVQDVQVNLFLTHIFGSLIGEQGNMNIPLLSQYG